jgi:uncharacterized protein (DUF427 family)
MVERVEPGPGQESVWDYPRPPRVEPSTRHVVVRFGGMTIADTRQAVRVLETSHPPVYYVPPHHVRLELMKLNAVHTHCEYKGMASYYDLSLDGRTVRNVAWVYPDPLPGYEALRGQIAFYPGRVDEAFVDGERVAPQEGDFYGGWITSEVVGPFKGGAGTWTW